MKKTTKKLNIKKETVVSFETLSTREIIGIHGGGRSDVTEGASMCSDCDTNQTCDINQQSQ